MAKLNHPNFSFKYTSLNHTLNLHPNKTHDKIIKENKDIVTFLIHHNCNNSYAKSPPLPLCYADVKPVF